MSLHFFDGHLHAVCRYTVAAPQQIAFQLHHQSGKRLGMSLDIGEGLLLEAERTLELSDVRLAVEDVGMFVYAHVEPLLLVALVRDLANDLLHDIFERYQTLRRAVLVDDYGKVYLLALEVFQQIVYLLVLGHEVGLAQQLLPAEIIAVVDVRQQVFHV
jgi:hypothetical protein